MKQEEQKRKRIKQMSLWDIRCFCHHGIHICESSRKIKDVPLHRIVLINECKRNQKCHILISCWGVSASLEMSDFPSVQALAQFPLGSLWCPMDTKVPWENLIQSAQGSTECVLQLSSKILFCVTSELLWSLRTWGSSRHEGGWIDFGDNLACYSRYPCSSWDRMCRKTFCLLCLGLN